MELKHLETFIQVAELSSFTKAAEKLGYSQSSISFQIKQLESHLNAQLFERINHTVTLTERGEEILQYAHRITALAREMEKPAAAPQELTGHVRIAMADSLCHRLLEHDYVTFHNRYPGITLTVIAASTEDMFRLLNQNEVDLVYTFDNHIYDQNYVIVHEEKMAVHFVARPDYFTRNQEMSSMSPVFLDALTSQEHVSSSPASQEHASSSLEETISLEQLLSQPFLLTEKGMSYRRLMDEKLASMSLEIHPILETGNTSLICRLVEQGMGISFLPDYVTEKSVEAGLLRRFTIKELKIDIWKQLLHHRDKWISPQMQATMKSLSEIQLHPHQ